MPPVTRRQLGKQDNRRNLLTEFVRQLVAKDGHGRADASCQVGAEGGTCRKSEGEIAHSSLFCAETRLKMRRNNRNCFQIQLQWSW